MCPRVVVTGPAKRRGLQGPLEFYSLLSKRKIQTSVPKWTFSDPKPVWMAPVAAAINGHLEFKAANRCSEKPSREHFKKAFQEPFKEPLSMVTF